MIDILNRWTRAVVYHSESAQTIAEAVAEAVERRAYLNRADLSGAYLSGADLNRAYLNRANLSDANLSGADLNRAYLSGAYLNRADLSGADLSGADLSGANLSDAYLSGAYLSDANLSGANLSRANLSGANLSRAYLSEADLSGAYLSRADLSGAYRLYISGSMHPLAATASGTVRIGCHAYQIERWLESYRTIGAREKYTPEQIEEYGRYLRIVQAWIEAQKPAEVTA
jgi:hypothetical protein